MCLSEDAAEVAKEFNPVFQCDNESKQLANPLDPSCAVAGYQAEVDAITACKHAVDADATPCVWCAAGSSMGVCLNNDQAAIATQWLQCDESAVLIATE